MFSNIRMQKKVYNSILFDSFPPCNIGSQTIYYISKVIKTVDGGKVRMGKRNKMN